MISPRQWLHLIDFWNLRALGLRVYPAPTGELDTAGKCLSPLVREHWQQRDGRPDFWRWTAVVRGRALDEDNSNALWDAMDVPQRALMGSSYPRLWEEFGREHDIGQERGVEAEQDNVDVTLSDDHGVFPLLKPRFIRRHRFNDKPLWANEIQVRGLGGRSSLATVFHPSLGNVDRLLESISRQSVYCSPRGTLLVYAFDASPNY